MSSRKKGKRVMLDTPGDQSDISEFTPGTMDLQGKVDSDNTAVLSTDDSPFAPLSMADWVSPATTAAPAGNAYEQQWSRIRPDRDPSVPQDDRRPYVGRGRGQLGAPSIDGSSTFLFGEQGQSSSSSQQIPLGTSFQSMMRPPPLPPHLRRAPSGMFNIVATPQQAGSANIYPGLPGSSHLQLPHSQPSTFPGGHAPQVGQAGQGGFPGVPSLGLASGGQHLPAVMQLPRYDGPQFLNFAEIEEYLEKPAWFPYPLDWMIPIGEVEQRPYIAKVYNAIVDTTSTFDQHPGYTALFRPGGRWSDPREIEAVSYLVISTAIKIHQRGVVGPVFKGRQPPHDGDKAFTFTQRIHFVVILLTNFKLYAHEFMMQRRLEDTIGRVWSVLSSDATFKSWWSRLSKEEKDKILLLDPYEGMTASHPDVQEYERLRVLSINMMMSASSAATGQQQVGYGYPGSATLQASVGLGHPALQQHHFPAGPIGSNQQTLQLRPGRSGKRRALGEGSPQSGSATKRQWNPMAVSTTALTGFDGLPRTLQSTPTAAELGFHNPLAQHVMDFDQFFPGVDQTDAGLDVLGLDFDPLGQRAGPSQPSLESAHGQRNASAQSVANAVSEGVEERGGGDGDAEGSDRRSEGEDDGSWMKFLV